MQAIGVVGAPGISGPRRVLGTWHGAPGMRMPLSSCLMQIPIARVFHTAASRDGHIGRGHIGRSHKQIGISAVGLTNNKQPGGIC